VYFTGDSASIVSGNTIRSNQNAGIFVMGPANFYPTIQSNPTISSNNIGIYAYYSSPTVYNNTISSPSDTKPGIIADTSFSNITYNNMVGTFGIDVISSGVTIENNGFTDNQYGIRFTNDPSSLMINNTLISNNHAIYMVELYNSSSKILGNIFNETSKRTGGAGILVAQNSNGTEITNNTLVGQFYSIRITSSTNISIKENGISPSEPTLPDHCDPGAVYMLFSSTAFIDNNNINYTGKNILGGCAYGISLVSGSYATITNNTINDVNIGIGVAMENGLPSSATINNNTIKSVRIGKATDKTCGIGISNSNVTVYNNTIQNIEWNAGNNIYGSGIILYGGNILYHTHIYLNDISNTDQSAIGIKTYELTNTTIENNTIEGLYEGIASQGAPNIIKYNMVSANVWGLHIFSPSDAKIYNNIITSNEEGIRFYNMPSSYIFDTFNDIMYNTYGITLENTAMKVANQTYYVTWVYDPELGSYKVYNGLVHNTYALYAFDSSTANIVGNNITNNDYGIYSEDSSPTIANNEITDAKYGIVLDGVYAPKYIEILNNNISSNPINGYGIYIYNTYMEPNYLSSNLISDNYIGIYVYGQTPVCINNNIGVGKGIISNKYGIYYYVSIPTLSKIYFNDISLNEYGIYLYNSHPQIYLNTLLNNSQIGIWADHNSEPLITNNNSIGSSSIGIYLRDSSSIVEWNNVSLSSYSGITVDDSIANVTHNDLWSNYRGLHVNGSGSVELEFSNNTINGVTTWGINIEDTSSNIKILNNTITTTDYEDWKDGIRPGYSTVRGNYITNFGKGIYGGASTIEYNTITMNDLGIHIPSGSIATIAYNNITKNSIGIYSGASGSVSITYNDITNNSAKGVWLIGSSSNAVVHHNNLVNISVSGGNAQDDGSSNQWDNSYPSGGNYWSHYSPTCQDLYDGSVTPQTTGSPDGICDYPYLIPGSANSYDYYPRVNPVPL